jgi:hypothetical protein
MAVVLRLEVVSTRYVVEVPRVQAHALFTMEEPTLLDRLGKVPGVSDVEYDGMLGPFVHLTIDDESDTPRKHEAIEGVIRGALKDAAAKAKESAR